MKNMQLKKAAPRSKKVYKPLKTVKKTLAALLSASLAASPCGFALADSESYFESFESAVIGQNPDNIECMPGAGRIYVADVGGEQGKALFIETENDGTYVSVKKQVSPLFGTYPVRAALKFMQPHRCADAVIMQIYSGDTLLVSVEARGGDIAYKTQSGYKTLISGYGANVFYDISAILELSSGTAEITAGGMSAETELLGKSSSADALKSFTRLSPGFVIDDISFGHVIGLKAIEITGAESPAVPKNGSASYSYKACAVDNKNNAMTSAAFSWSIEPSEMQGIKLEADGASAKITVTPDAVSGAGFRLVCTSADNPQVRCEKTVTPQSGVTERIEIGADGALVPGIKEKINLTVTGYDSFGNAAQTHGAVFGLKEECSDFSITPSGELTLANPSTDREYITVTAELSENSAVSAEKKVFVTDVRTYLNDESRRGCVKEYFDTVLRDAADTYRGTPLLCNGIDKDGRHVLWDFVNGDHSAMSDIGNQMELLRAMTAYSDITGDMTYKDRVTDIYRYTIENDMRSNLVLWGPHASLDLKTGEKAAGNGYHEIESKDMYLTPFFEIAPDKAEAMVKQVWMGHIIDWKSLWFNRHASYGKVVKESATWDNTEQFIDNPEDPFIRDHEGQSFFVAASEYLHFATELYKRTGDEKALLWAKRLAYKYVNAKDSITGMLPLTFTTGYKAPGIKEMPPEIWELPQMPYSYQTTNYGDRAYNQFAQPLRDEGRISDAETEHIIEAYFYESFPWVYSYNMLEVLELCEQLGLKDESDGGFDLLSEWMTAMAKYIKTAYSPSGNSVAPMFACGVKLSGYKTKRCGYYGSRGRVLVSHSVTSSNMLSVLEAALATDRFESLKEENETFCSALRSMGRGLLIGDIGDPMHGIEPKLDYTSDVTDPVLLDIMLRLYEKTENYSYLKMARLIGNNICENSFSGGLFVDADTYSTVISLHAPLSLMKLDAEINGKSSNALDYRYPSYVYLQERFVDDHGYVDETNQHSDKYYLTYQKVKPTDILTGVSEIALKSGESFPIEVTVLPDDAGDKEVYWEIDDGSIAQIDDDNVLTAKMPGTTYVRAVSETLSVMSERVKVTVE